METMCKIFPATDDNCDVQPGFCFKLKTKSGLDITVVISCGKYFAYSFHLTSYYSQVMPFFLQTLAKIFKKIWKSDFFINGQPIVLIRQARYIVISYNNCHITQ